MSRIWDMLGFVIVRYWWVGRLFIYIELGEEMRKNMDLVPEFTSVIGSS